MYILFKIKNTHFRQLICNEYFSVGKNGIFLVKLMDISPNLHNNDEERHLCAEIDVIVHGWEGLIYFIKYILHDLRQYTSEVRLRLGSLNNGIKKEISHLSPLWEENFDYISGLFKHNCIKIQKNDEFFTICEDCIYVRGE
jgi:hypothetical protein